MSSFSVNSADSICARLDKALAAALSERRGRPVFVALSGGMDSMLLLERLATMPEVARYTTAIHVHHGLTPDADGWQTLCERRCAQLSIPLITEKVQVEAAGKGIEAAARQARYSAFEQHVSDGGVLLMAHHGSDQAETLLLRLFRGSGLSGLRGIPHERPLKETEDTHGGSPRVIVRPWLSFSRRDLMSAATSLDMQWAEDSSNTDETFDRNWLRHSQMPALMARYPSLEQTLMRTADHLEDDYRLLQALLQPLCDKVVSECCWPATGRYRLNLNEISQQPQQVHFHLLRHWLVLNQVAVPESTPLMHWLAQCLSAAADKQPLLMHGDVRLQRHRHHLYVWSEQSTPDTVNDIPDTWGLGRIMSHSSAASVLPTLPGHFELRPARRCTDACIRPEGRPAQRLKSIWQAYGVPPWLREHWPLLVRSGDAVAVIGLMNDCSLKCEAIDILRLEWR